MRILVVSPYLPHPRATHGTGVFMDGLLKQLMIHHQITLLSFCDSDELQKAEDLRGLPIDVHTRHRPKGMQKGVFRLFRLVVLRLVQMVQSVILWQPYYVRKYFDRGMARSIGELTGKTSFDIVQFEFAFMGQYARFARSGKLVLHEHDVAYRPSYRRFKNASGVIQRFLRYCEWCRWARYEPRLVRQFDHVLTVTEQDRLLLLWLSRSKRISYLPRGMHVPDTLPEFASREPRTLLFVGTFDHQPNVDAALWLARDILPDVARQFPDTIAYIVGANPPPELIAMGADNPRLRVLGFVTDVIPYLERSAVFVAPLRFGGGVKLKIIHAMARGIPVVTTKIGMEGIDGLGADSALVGNTADSLVRHICAFLGDTQYAAHIGTRGWETARQFYSWGSVSRRIEGIYEEIQQPQVESIPQTGHTKR